MQQWLLMNKKADFKAIGEKFQIDQVTARILRNREVVGDENIRRFLTGDLKDLYNPHLLKDGERLVDEVIAGTGLPVGKVLATLTLLEVKGVVRRLPGKRVRLG